MTIPQILVLFFAAMLAGALNSVAGGGSFISFPALVWTGVPYKVANITNTVALWPGSIASVGAYRKELVEQEQKIVPILIVSLIGGVLGALLLLATPESTFGYLLPWLLLLATLLFIYGRKLSIRLRGKVEGMQLHPSTMLGLVLFAQFVVSLYGGFFGGGIGIMMLAVLSLWGMDNIHNMNAIKTLLATCINGAAVVAFMFARTIMWPQALLMIVGAIVGGYFGAYYARKVDPQKVRGFVMVVAIIMTVYFFIRTYLPVGA
jgi:uncharacterized membrane protein YfcA